MGGTLHMHVLVWWWWCCGGSFFLTQEDLRRMFDDSFPACIFFFFLVEISSCTFIPLFRLHGRFPHQAWTAAQLAYSDFTGSKVYACLGVSCHLHFWQNDQGLLRATAVTWGVERTPSAHKVDWRRKFTCQDSNLQPFNHKSCGLTNRLFRLPMYLCMRM